MVKPRAIIIRTAGTNCDYETKAAFELAGAAAERIHINKLISGEVGLRIIRYLRYQADSRTAMTLLREGYSRTN